ncbi:MAG: hypothetical protein A3A43_00325 [Candidatus Liptonbacteria bacterium RIFCSPLOWO2_01_FULL_56_20]|uniref:EfeO-type cupredoxin-like domain-containing protein n=1 Tax=Candidatus Liptonbacteria bacterium RIFCSPLOWO2_01_FULL_56_20 TaxID=1798652 RepID=A0A1G2CIM0_9BACT|nr:MAG: Plastocyanin [Parcubacteria group bacterium GW2011_GWB1_56_8]OGY98116.1 MAG: hypothetical protein A2681_02710 [Candidatus Liptonbacteria bacterium RIFCSPHIGHO2_01_FULL_56_18b]OGZ01077.1 MAG: hypothetical protein A3A43_00325 [Candidatus Liptonbacteria bacterium RIFCSPLOWO2_01_FULL_56_20]
MSGRSWIILVVIFLILLIAGGIVYYMWRSAPEELTPPAQAPAAGPAPQPTPPTAVIPAGTLITYTASGYSPSTLTVRVGTVVTFKNNSAGPMWPASAMHPSHAVYPTIGGCVGSTFDACKPIQPGETWTFEFDIAGKWKYHDHLSPAFTGTVVVGETSQPEPYK